MKRCDFVKYQKSLCVRGIHRILQYLHPLIGERLFLKALYLLYMHVPLNLDNPLNFTEKMQWLKLYYRHEDMPAMACKRQARDIVADKIGDDYLVPLIGCWDNPEDIPFDSLPDKFVLKATNGGGGNGVVICLDKNILDREKTVRILKNAMRNDVAGRYGEWHYAYISPKVIAEEVLDNGNPIDYKFFCFDGKPLFLKVDMNRLSDHTLLYMDMDWNRINLGDMQYPSPENGDIPGKPDNFNEMTEIASLLSQGWPFIRIDLYNVEGGIYFGEFTFFSASGLVPYYPENADKELGKLVSLPARRGGMR